MWPPQGPPRRPGPIRGGQAVPREANERLGPPSGAASAPGRVGTTPIRPMIWSTPGAPSLHSPASANLPGPAWGAGGGRRVRGSGMGGPNAQLGGAPRAANWPSSIALIDHGNGRGLQPQWVPAEPAAGPGMRGLLTTARFTTAVLPSRACLVLHQGGPGVSGRRRGRGIGPGRGFSPVVAHDAHYCVPAQQRRLQAVLVALPRLMLQVGRRVGLRRLQGLRQGLLGRVPLHERHLGSPGCLGCAIGLRDESANEIGGGAMRKAAGRLSACPAGSTWLRRQGKTWSARATWPLAPCLSPHPVGLWPAFWQRAACVPVGGLAPSFGAAAPGGRPGTATTRASLPQRSGRKSCQGEAS